MAPDKELYAKFVKTLLNHSREFVSSNELSDNRLPLWVDAAEVEISRAANSFVYLVKGKGGGKDRFIFTNELGPELQAIFKNETPRPYATSNATRKDQDRLSILGTFDKDSGASGMKIESDALFEHSGAHHPPLLISDLFLELDNEDGRHGPFFISLCGAIHELDLQSIESVLNIQKKQITDSLVNSYSRYGDFYSGIREKDIGLETGKEELVIVLGSYSEDAHEELLRIREWYRRNGYRSFLIEELPRPDAMSMEELVRFWGLNSRFCVMVDKVPSGHLNEIELLKNQRTLTAVLRPAGSNGSTSMFGEASKTDLPFIGNFEYEESPVGILPSATEWAEEFIDGRVESYNEEYDW